MQNLLSGSGPFLNGIHLESGVTVFDDGDIDTLTGNVDLDLFFANLLGSGVFDGIVDMTSLEIEVDL